MAKYASYYAPINQALQNMNAQLNENSRRKMAAEYQLAQTKLATAKYLGEQNDPRRLLAIAQATEQLKPTPLNIGSNMPNGKGTDRYSMEQWNAFKPHVASIVGDANAQVKPDGSIIGSDGKPMVLPAYQAAKIKNRINAAQMFEFDDEAIRRGKMRKFNDDITRLEGVYRKTKDPSLKMRIGGMKENLAKMDAEYNHPQRRLLSLKGKMNQIDQHLAQSFMSPSPDKGWVETLKWQQKRAQDEYNALLKAMGKDGKAEGIQLKRYQNPTTGEVVEYPVSKFEGAAFRITDPLVGGKQHRGQFVLKDTAGGQLSPKEAVDTVNSYINNYSRNQKQITLLNNALQGGKASKAMLDVMAAEGEIDAYTMSLLSTSSVDEKEVKNQIAHLQAVQDQARTLYKEYRSPIVRNRLDEFFNEGGKQEDPAGLLGTSVGERYKGSGADSVLFE